jgi:hypothetical protein
VNLVATSPDSGGNVVVPRSHHRFASIGDQYFRPPRLSKKGNQLPAFVDYRALAHAEPSLFAGAISCHLEAGDLFLWDSRTIHGNSVGQAMDQAQQQANETKTATASTTASDATSVHADATTAIPGGASATPRVAELLRCAAFVRMAPRNKVPPAARGELAQLRR